MICFFDLFFIYDELDRYTYFYPENISEFKEKAFLYPCNDFGNYQHDLYIMVFTDINGTKNYVVTKYLKPDNLSLGIKSENCWFELYYCIMNNIVNSQLYKSKDKLRQYFSALINLPPPDPGLIMYIPSFEFDESATKVSIPKKNKLMPFPTFMTSLYKYLRFENWLIIFESLLLEKWIIFHSNHLHRVSNCLFAMLSLIFPLEWVHLVFPCLSKESVNCLGCPSPFIAGIHSCLLDEALNLLNPSTVIVDIDKGEVSYVLKQNNSTIDGASNNEDDEFVHLPKPLINLLYRSYREFQMKLSAIKNDPTDVDKLWLQLSTAFLNIIAILIGKYSKFKYYDEKKSKFLFDKEAMSKNIPQFEEFVSQMLQSQMVHQFIDTKLNDSPSGTDSLDVSTPGKKKKQSFRITTNNDVDDFSEACKSVSKWIPDQYVEKLANITSLGREKINVFTAKVQKTIQQTKLSNEPNSIFYVSQLKSNNSVSEKSTNDSIQKGTSSTQPHTKNLIDKNKCSNTTNKIVRPARTDWVQFDDACSSDFPPSISTNTTPNADLLLLDAFSNVSCVEVPANTIPLSSPSQTVLIRSSPSDNDNFNMISWLDDAETNSTNNSLSTRQKPIDKKDRVTSIIRDFDPLFS